MMQPGNTVYFCTSCDAHFAHHVSPQSPSPVIDSRSALAMFLADFTPRRKTISPYALEAGKQIPCAVACRMIFFIYILIIWALFINIMHNAAEIRKFFWGQLSCWQEDHLCPHMV